jgi:Protein of unknown function (DUF1573)
MQKSIYALFLLAFAKMLYAQPSIRFDSTLINYGTIEEGSEPYRSVRIWNDAPKSANPADSMLNALIIRSAKGSCGCIVPTYTKEPIPPGRFGVLGIRYDTKRLGPFTKTVTVECNDAQKPTHLVTIKGNVYPRGTRPSKGILTLLDISVDVGTLVRGDTSAVFSVKISNTGKEMIHLDDMWLSNGKIVEQPCSLQPQEIGVIRFRMINEKSAFYKGKTRDTLHIQGNTQFLPQGDNISVFVNRL